MSLIQILDSPIAFHRCFLNFTGSVNTALLLSQMVYWTNRTSDPDGWFYKSMSEWEQETGMTRREQETARKVLKDLQVVEERHDRIEHKMWFRINTPVFDRFVMKSGHLRQPMAESATAQCPKAPLPDGGKRHSTKEKVTTSKTTNTKNGVLFFMSAEELPPPLNTPAVMDAWDCWQAHYQQKTGTKQTERSAHALVNRLKAIGPERAIAAINHSIEKNWTGVFENTREESAERTKARQGVDWSTLTKENAL